MFRVDAAPIDYGILAVYFAVVLGIGLVARRSVHTGLDFFLSGRSLPAWITGLAFIAANLGALEILGLAVSSSSSPGWSRSPSSGSRRSAAGAGSRTR